MPGSKGSNNVLEPCLLAFSLFLYPSLYLPLSHSLPLLALEVPGGILRTPSGGCVYLAFRLPRVPSSTEQSQAIGGGSVGITSRTKFTYNISRHQCDKINSIIYIVQRKKLWILQDIHAFA